MCSFFKRFKQRQDASSSLRQADMTQGSILPHLIRFALPMLFGSIFSLLYNTVDIWVLGNFGTNEAYAAVGSVGSLVSLFISFYNGFGTSVGLVLAQQLGARKYSDAERTVHTACSVFFLFGLFLTGFGLLSCPSLLRLIAVPEDIFEDARIYMNIYFLGIPASILSYVILVILRSSGQTKVPVLIGIASTVLNTILDLIFVIIFRMGVAGVAIATVISQYFDASLQILCLAKNRTAIRLVFSKLQIHWQSLRRVILIGVPITLQNAIGILSNTLIQTHINHFGSDFISAWATYVRLQDLLTIPLSPLLSAITVFTAQNLGAAKPQRIRQCVRIGLVTCGSIAVTMGISAMLLATPLTAFFNGKEEVVAVASKLVRFLAPLLVFNHIVNVFGFSMQGMGDTKTPSLVVICIFTILRQLYMFIVKIFSGNFYLLVCGFPISWIIGVLIMYLCYRRTFRKNAAGLSPTAV